uniref:Uncharacterized protein n=1 Tax=Magallana gigas TaxID=29159 RepID=A0A8W8JCU7_MAGGI
MDNERRFSQCCCFLVKGETHNLKDMDCRKLFWFLFILTLEFGDLVLDWEFFYEISKTDEVNYELQTSILAFAVVGSVLFILIVANKIYLFCCNEYGNHEEENAYSFGLSILSTFIEDLPQIVLAIFVALTTKELVSPVQIAKSVYAIVEPCIQIVMNVVEIRNMKKQYKQNKGRIICKVIEIIISVIIVLCSITLLINLVKPLEHYINM